MPRSAPQTGVTKVFVTFELLPRLQSVLLSSESVQNGSCIDHIQQLTALRPGTMGPKLLASEIINAGADKVLEKNPKRVDDAVANAVIKQGANALESGVSKGNVDPALGAAAEVDISNVSYRCTCTCNCK